MKLKFKILCITSALCFLGSGACFSAFAAEQLQLPSGDEEYTTPVVVEEQPVTVEPTVPVEPVAPVITTEPDPATTYTPDPVYTESYTTEQPVTTDPGYTEPDTTGTQTGTDQTYSATYTDVISDGNFPAAATYSVPTTDYYSSYSTNYNYDYAANAQQYNQYLYNTYQAQYDDNYIYVPEYEAPAESLIETSSKQVDTDELTKDDWKSIMLDLSDGNLNDDGAQTFSFIKDNEEKGDSNMMWMVYLGTALIIASILMVIFVFVTMGKENAKNKEFYYV